MPMSFLRRFQLPASPEIPGHLRPPALPPSGREWPLAALRLHTALKLHPRGSAGFLQASAWVTPNRLIFWNVSFKSLFKNLKNFQYTEKHTEWHNEPCRPSLPQGLPADTQPYPPHLPHLHAHLRGRASYSRPRSAGIYTAPELGSKWRHDELHRLLKHRNWKEL